MIHFISKYTKKLTLRSFMLGIAVASMTASVLTACVDNDFSDKNYYTATKRTAAQLISDSPERYSKFQQILERHGVTATVRRTLGSDIDASCGQLRRKFEGTQKEESLCRSGE